VNSSVLNLGVKVPKVLAEHANFMVMHFWHIALRYSAVTSVLLYY